MSQLLTLIFSWWLSLNPILAPQGVNSSLQVQCRQSASAGGWSFAKNIDYISLHDNTRRECFPCHFKFLFLSFFNITWLFLTSVFSHWRCSSIGAKAILSVYVTIAATIAFGVCALFNETNVQQINAGNRFYDFTQVKITALQRVMFYQFHLSSHQILSMWFLSRLSPVSLWWWEVFMSNILKTVKFHRNYFSSQTFTNNSDS